MNGRDITSAIDEVAKNYRYQKTPEIMLYAQELLSRIRRFIADLLNMLNVNPLPTQSDTRLIGNLMQVGLTLAGVGALALILYFCWKRMGQLTHQSQAARRGQAESETVLDAAGWRKQADEFASKSQFNFACRALYFALIKILDEKGILDFAPARTNYEYWYALARQKQIAMDFRELADVVEECWFGNRTASQDDFQKCSSLLDKASKEIEAVHVTAKEKAAQEKVTA